MSWQEYVFFGLALAFDHLEKSKYIRFQRKIFELHLGGFLLVVVVVHVITQVYNQLVQAMRNSDPRVRIVSVYRFNSNFHSICTLWVAGCDFQYGPNFGVPSNPTCRVRWFFISWQRVLTTSTESVNCENSSVSSVMKYCPTSTFVRNPASVQILITRFCCDSLSSRSWHFCNRSSCEGSSVEGVGVFINELFGKKQWVRLSYHDSSPSSNMARFVFFTQIWDCSVNTELIHRSNCARNNFKSSPVSAEVHW